MFFVRFGDQLATGDQFANAQKVFRRVSKDVVAQGRLRNNRQEVTHMKSSSVWSHLFMTIVLSLLEVRSFGHEGKITAISQQHLYEVFESLQLADADDVEEEGGSNAGGLHVDLA